MSLLIPDEGAPELLLYTLLGGDYGTPDFRLALYINNYTPVPATTKTDFAEATFTGYSQYTIDNAKWGSPTIVSHRAQSVYDVPGPVEWTNGGGSAQTVYGYFVWSYTSGYVMWAELFTTPRTLNPGDKLDLTPVFNGGTQT